MTNKLFTHVVTILSFSTKTTGAKNTYQALRALKESQPWHWVHQKGFWRYVKELIKLFVLFMIWQFTITDSTKEREFWLQQSTNPRSLCQLPLLLQMIDKCSLHSLQSQISWLSSGTGTNKSVSLTSTLPESVEAWASHRSPSTTKTRTQF
jgi:hypothetical protein